MEESMRRFACSFFFAAVLVLGAPAPSPALTLGQLVGGASFSTGSLTFSDFQATAAGSADPTFDDYAVQVLPDGFRISGPVSASLGQTGTLLLSYNLTSAALGIVGASLFSSGFAVGTGSQALVTESLSGAGNTPVGTLVVYDVAGVGTIPFSSMDFGPASVVSIAETLQVKSGILAAVPLVDQHFLTVPEPMTFLLFSTGIIGLLLSGRRRHEARGGQRASAGAFS
jgi:hypothetical protein